MAKVTVTDIDVQNATTFLVGYLQDRYPDIDLTPGSVFRDILVDGMASIVAYLLAEVDRLRSLQSLKLIESLPDDSDKDDAVDALLSNFFITRNAGRYSRGIATLHLTDKVDITVPVTATFTVNQLIFNVDATDDVFISQNDLVEVLDSAGQPLEYTATINLVSSQIGAEYDIAPGTFTDFTKFSPYVVSVTNENQFSGGKSSETTTELLARAPDAISLRGMITEKAIKVTLMDTFTNILGVTVVGFGDPEMHRDSLPFAEFHSGLHRGGFIDVYIDTPLKEDNIYEGVYGDAVSLSQLPHKYVLIDASVTDFIAAGVLPTDTSSQYLKLYDTVAGEPDIFYIKNVDSNYITVDPRTPFPTQRSGVDYSIGDNTTYDNIVSRRQTGEITDKISGNFLVLPQFPFTRIKDVSIYDPAGTYPGLADPVDKRIHFVRSNEAPSISYGSPGYTPTYFVKTLDVTTYGSSYQALMIEIDPVFVGETVRVIYDTIVDFDTIDSFVVDSDNRSATSNVLVRSFHPVYITFDIQYALKPTASSSTIDEAAIKLALVSYINNLTLTDKLNVSDIITFVMSQDDNIGSVVPKATVTGLGTVEYAISYSLHAPDGRVIDYYTTDDVTISAAKLVDNNPPNDLTDEKALSYGISTRTIKYLTTTSDITFTKV